MARQGTKSVIMYTTRDKQLAEAFDAVHKHYGAATYTQSGVLAELVRRKYDEIQDKKTRRDQLAGLREDVDALKARLDEQAEFIVFMGEIVKALMKKGYTANDVADLFACTIEMLPEFVEAHTPGR